jgi:hypothetical protein
VGPRTLQSQGWPPFFDPAVGIDYGVLRGTRRNEDTSGELAD